MIDVPRRRKPKILADYNLLSEYFIHREYSIAAAQKLLEIIESGEIDIYIMSKALHEIEFSHDLLIKEGRINDMQIIKRIRQIFRPFTIDIDWGMMEEAKTLAFTNFYSAVDLVCALRLNLDGILTLDPNNFTQVNCSILPVENLSSLYLVNLSNSDNLYHSVNHWFNRQYLEKLYKNSVRYELRLTDLLDDNFASARRLHWEPKEVFFFRLYIGIPLFRIVKIIQLNHLRVILNLNLFLESLKDNSFKILVSLNVAEESQNFLAEDIQFMITDADQIFLKASPSQDFPEIGQIGRRLDFQANLNDSFGVLIRYQDAEYKEHFLV